MSEDVKHIPILAYIEDESLIVDVSLPFDGVGDVYDIASGGHKIICCSVGPEFAKWILAADSTINTQQIEIDALKAQLTKVRDYLVKTWGYNLDENQKPDCGEDELTLGCNKLLNQKPCSTLNCHEWIDLDGPDTCESCQGLKMEHEEGEVENES